MPLYDAMTIFRLGRSHMALVVPAVDLSHADGIAEGAEDEADAPERKGVAARLMKPLQLLAPKGKKADDAAAGDTVDVEAPVKPGAGGADGAAGANDGAPKLSPLAATMSHRSLASTSRFKSVKSFFRPHPGALAGPVQVRLVRGRGACA